MTKLKITFILPTLLITGCIPNTKTYYPIKQCNNQDKIYTNYQKCDLTNIKDYYDVISGDDKNDNVLLFLEGGPSLSSSGKKWKDSAKKTSSLQAAASGLVSYYLINQSQWLKQAKFLDGDLTNFTHEDAFKEHLETVNKTHKVIKHLKSQGKKVGLVGSSYGAFLVNQYLAMYGDDTPDFVLSIAGRLKMKNSANILKAYIKMWKERKYDVLIESNDNYSLLNLNESSQAQFRNISKNAEKLAINLGHYNLIFDYTKVIKDKNLNKTTFLSAAPDGNVGWFNQEEITWAKQRNAQVDFFNEQETTKQFDLNHPLDKRKGETRRIAIKDYAHTVGYWDAFQTKKYFIDPFYYPRETS